MRTSLIMVAPPQLQRRLYVSTIATRQGAVGLAGFEMKQHNVKSKGSLKRQLPSSNLPKFDIRRSPTLKNMKYEISIFTGETGPCRRENQSIRLMRGIVKRQADDVHECT